MTKLLTFVTVLALVSCQQPLRTASAETQNIYDARGNKIGSSTTNGNTTDYYDARGNRTGSATTSPSGTTNFFDTRGNREGSTTAPFGRELRR